MQPAPDYVPWRMRYSTEFMFEIDTRQIRARLPRRLFPVEVRPGVALLSIGSTVFEEGNATALPSFTEITVSALVQPSFAKMSDFGVPKIAVYVFRVCATSDAFLRYTSEVDKVPVFETRRLEIEIEESSFRTIARDEHGPIFDLANVGGEPSFKPQTFPFQVVTVQDDFVHLANVQVDGQIFEHQEKGEFGRLFPHPFFGGLDVSRCRLYMQYVSPPRSGAVMKWRPPMKLMPARA